MSVQVSYKKQFALAIILILVFFAVVEIFAIVFAYQNTTCWFADREAVDYLSIENKRQICESQHQMITYKNFTNVPNQHYDAININSHGFRGEEITKEKPENTFRIFLVGGSTTFGAVGISDRHTISGYLQEEFDDKNLEFNVEVINAGVPGSFSLAEINLVKKKIIHFDPDLIIVYDGWNDIGKSWIQFNLPERLDYSITKEIIEKFKLLSIYKTPLVFEKIYRDFKENNPQNYVKNYDEITASERSKIWAERWIDVCLLGNEKNFQTVIVLQPIVGSGNKILSEEEMVYYIIGNREKQMPYYAEFGNKLEELDKYCEKTIDLRNVFDGKTHSIFYDGGHANEEGKQIVASKLFESVFPLVLKK